MEIIIIITLIALIWVYGMKGLGKLVTAPIRWVIGLFKNE